MSDKSFGDYANRNIVKNPLLCTAVTGLSIEDLTHNAVLVPVAPNQGLITGSDQTGTHSQTLAHTDHEHTNFPSGDSNPNILHSHPPTSTISHLLDNQTTHLFDNRPELPTTTVSKASSKSEDDFDVNEYFARLQGTRYVSAPLHSHPDQTNLTETEENLEEINLNDDKSQEVQQSLTADIAQNFSQLPNVLPHVASAVFSSFSNMWNMKSREQTPDDRGQSYQDLQFQGTPSIQGSQQYQEVQFQGNAELNPFQNQGFGANVSSVPLMKTEDVAKEVAPPPKEPPICGASNFRLATKKKYAQIPGLTTREPQQIAFNPLTQNVPSYFIPTENLHTNIEENRDIPAVEHSSIFEEQSPRNNTETYNIFTPIDDTIAGASDCQPNIFMAADIRPKLTEETPPPINLQNEMPAIPPPPMFSTQKRENPTGKSVLPPSVARRLGSNHPVIKQQIMQPPLTDNIFIPTFDPTPPSEPIIPTNSTAVPTNISHPVQPILPTNLPPTPSQQVSTGVGTAPSINAPPFSVTKFPSSVAPIDKTAPHIFEPVKQTTAATIFTPTIPDYTMNVRSVPLSSDLVASSAGPTSLPPSSNIFSSVPAAPQIASTLPTATTVASYPAHNPVFFTPPFSTNTYSSNFNAATIQENLPPEPLKPLVEPPKTSGASNFRMTKKRPQYYSGPIEGFGSISNNIKPVIPTVDSGTFQGALFTPEQSQVETNAPSFDINQQTEIETSNSHFAITNSAPTIPAAPFVNQALSYPNYDAPQPYQDYGQQYNASFDLTRSDTSYEPPEEPKESKGFGIIGSLKSKLSSIDINKIQSSVTTFFDPGYKDVKKDDALAQQNVSYEPPQYSQIQSNFDIFMPNTEQTMPNSSSMVANQNTYGQMNYDPSSQYNAYHQQNLTYGDDNYSYQTYPTSYYSEPSQNQQTTSNIYLQSNTTKTIESTTVKHEDKGNIFGNMPVIDVNKTVDNSQKDRTPIAQTLNLPAVEKTCIKDYFKSESSLQPQSENKYEENTSNFITSEPKPIIKSNIFEYIQAETAPTEYRNICTPDIDTKAQLEITSTAYDHKANAVKGPQHKYPQPIGSEAKAMFHDDAKSNISGYGTQNVLFPVVAQDNIRQDVKSDCVFPSIEHDTKGKDEIPLEDNLLQSLSKEQVPILSVSSVPLFGLAAIVTDKVKNNESNDEIGLPLYERVKNKDIEDKQASISFFENIGTAIQKEHDDNKNDGILNANRNINFLEIGLEAKPVEHDAQISNVSFFTIDQKSEECDSTTKGSLLLNSETNLYENVDAVSETEDLNVRANIDTVLAGEENINDFKDTVNIPADIEIRSELNICETCREVNKPDETDVEKDDLTWQLIENINSPIQLLNPVEVPLTESDISADRVEFDVNQFEEISHITEETIETLHVQSATELLEDDDITKLSYGWAPGQTTVHSMMHTTNLSKQHDYSYTVDPNIIGFIGDPQRNDKVPTNASDELKAEFIHQEDILPRQMSIPSAPPAEEDSKSDEAGILDVHSIELDAKEDYSVYEEFVIEPSETDDDKIECKEREKTEESELDSFTNRVEKFKTLEEVPDIEEHKRAPTIFEQQVQPISMASYFDTGNYAADNHYRNTMCSPSQISIPPGFEEEFKKRLALAKAKELIKTVPETSTQTKVTVSVTTAHSVMPFGYNVVTSTSKVVQEKAEIVPDTPLFASGLYKAPESAKISSSHYEPVDFTKQASEITCQEIKTDSDKSGEVTLTKTSPIFGTRAIQIPTALSEFDSSAVKMLHTSSLFGSEGVIPQTSNLFESSDTAIPKSSSAFNPPQTLPIEVTMTDTKPSPKKEAPILTDPLNFFADSNTNVPTENLNRLASYFSTPPKTDHAKSFFELSQSQNHYKHASSTEKYTDLMKDLTSVQNFTVPTDQTIRHVNYFTVEYDVVLPEFNKGDSSKDVLLDTDDKDLESLNHCSYCTALIYQKRYKVRSSMNNNSEERNAEPTMEVSNTYPTNSVTVNFDGVTVNEDTNESISAQAENRSNPDYGAVKHHWFYRVDVEDKSIWRGFSVLDSRALETQFLSPDLNEDTLVPTDGGRYDVNLVGRLRIPVYWTDKPTNVRRCSWFYKGTTDPRYVPYTETVAQKLEEEYWHGMTTGVWHRRLVLPNNEVVVMHGPNVMVHFLNSDAFSSPPQSSSRPRVVRRGCDDSEIEDAEPSSIDHLLLLCHGVGSACDMRFRSVEEVVEDFRSTSLQLVQSHYKNSYDQGIVSRVEVLPISWHAALHSGETGVDRRLAQITLDSIPRLRNFTNDTVLDVLFYTSPVFCQTILNTVCKELNRIYQLFKVRNPSFKGGVSLGGHSLGSVILYDLLCHQSKESPQPEKHYLGSTAGTGRPAVAYPHLEFEPAALYALGSPIAIFECIRGIESLGVEFSLPTCKNFFNIFHPYDPIAYRIEPLINPRLKELKPYLIPHHKGRKRMHLELKDTMARVGADLKQKLVESLRNTWNKWKSVPVDGTLERVVEEELDKEQLFDETREELAKERELSTPEMLGHLNCGRRVDYVLQEAPLEMINEYLFAMSSHVGYWESEDTMLLMLREIYSDMGVQPDSTIPQQSMTVQRTKRLQGSPDSPSTSDGRP